VILDFGLRILDWKDWDVSGPPNGFLPSKSKIPNPKSKIGPVSYLPAILALLTGVAGWFYLFYSRAAHGLAGYERDRLNVRRIRLRRVGGVVMLLLAVGFYLGFYAADPDRHPRLFAWVWMGVLLLLVVIVVLAMIDVRLTLVLRNDLRARPDKGLNPPPQDAPDAHENARDRP
jgi:hypothetical protein